MKAIAKIKTKAKSQLELILCNIVKIVYPHKLVVSILKRACKTSRERLLSLA